MDGPESGQSENGPQENAAAEFIGSADHQVRFELRELHAGEQRDGDGSGFWGGMDAVPDFAEPSAILFLFFSALFSALASLGEAFGNLIEATDTAGVVFVYAD